MVTFPYDRETTTGRSYFSPCKTATDYCEYDLSDCETMTVTNVGCAEDHGLNYIPPEPILTGDLSYIADSGRSENDEPIKEPP